MTTTDRKLKRIELRLVAELMKNSRKSDRELAKILGISQPTVTRIRNKLEREGVIREYTAIPDGVIISLHRDYTSFQQLMTWLRQLDFLEVEKTQFFLVDLNETVRYRPLTLSAIAKHIEQQAEK